MARRGEMEWEEMKRKRKEEYERKRKESGKERYYCVEAHADGRHLVMDADGEDVLAVSTTKAFADRIVSALNRVEAMNKEASMKMLRGDA